ncbi:sphingomyelin phosphodiesterase [Coniophora puteana RWD-64-598 SS2]|uniref:Sphingomyelin phosphodiesterase n=1 Tax=Coniophora puteana (strain RWD-64-598) TaxID=741705 RepID=A0A5M3MK27_CONPW|nr:sphingomyelin phosphodiesterase [Coniophora puteana RWD-64-598 SS2]EIW79572.1 sphingomyelin phosphodiesterase [Coniophora puteana RWD-64-598 SS2]
MLLGFKPVDPCTRIFLLATTPMWRLLCAALAAVGIGSVSGADTGIVPSTYTAAGAFPTSAYASYYNSPTATSAQVQPVISDPVTHKVFPLVLTDPNDFPKNDTWDPHTFPPAASSTTLLEQAIEQIKVIAKNPAFGNNTCAQCQAGLEVAKFLALAAPEQGPNLAVAICEHFGFAPNCQQQYDWTAYGPVLTQVASYGNLGGYDGQLLCWWFLSLCPMPPTSPLNMTGYFAKPKPDPLPPPKQPSGKLLKVLHVSDLHLDPRYATGAEANCTDNLCCRKNVNITDSPQTVLFPAPRFGAYLCDTPYSLLLSAMEAIPPLTGTEEGGFNFSLFTGDITPHDPENQYSRAFVEYVEVVIYDVLKKYVGPAPVYATLGNHDIYDQFQSAPYSMGGALATQYNWLYEHISKMWEHEGWMSGSPIEYARTHYAAYSVKRTDGLKIISLNTNLWYNLNYFAYINATDPDTFGILRFLADELQDSEDAQERVWIIGHVLSGWDGTNTLNNPSNLFYQIVDRYSPHVIANIFWGHTHEDQFSIFYANNGTNMSAETAQTVSWIGPSLTPLTNLNSGFRVYEVDSATFDIVNAYTWVSKVNEYPSLDDQLEYGPSYFFEYSAREAYGGDIDWPEDAPLNATWWHLVTEQMENNSSLAKLFSTYQSKSSAAASECDEECLSARICYMRSGSASLAWQNCPPNYGSSS